MNMKSLEALVNARETLNRLLGEFVTGELIGYRLKKELEHIKKQIIIVEEQEGTDARKSN